MGLRLLKVVLYSYLFLMTLNSKLQGQFNNFYKGVDKYVCFVTKKLRKIKWCPYKPG